MSQTVKKAMMRRVILVLALVIGAFTLYFAIPGQTAKHVIPAANANESFTDTTQGCLAVFDERMRALHSKDTHDLCELTKGKVVMVVNTASQCGYTGQFEGLEALYQQYSNQDFVILGFPSDSFKQEHADEEKTADVCFVNFGVTFPMMATTAVLGSNANNVFKTLSAAANASPQWNFHKYVVSADGQQISSFASKIEPLDKQITDTIDAYLATN
ncbi:glutathione peroxidase [Pseudidiomarina woesei]|uniref:Glutathione peroxidase n=1 Tax=Pseudidiomarina woesei TaxID=1381080 RepID=A0A0K6H937_9GAMM|nr:glutathione peroxidase [Pseudidiomarina woesei]CUA87345.1 Glutathione peroxidase, house-cleaning role in reducing lipid peroxides [Pseudidiomarina woesei]